jgi:tRNA U34 5-methylaminomethyl-2-thiouridine-forming methyltransferase MnmC
MLEIVKTGDGSNTIFNSEVGENYHSKHGALQESRHVFLKSGLEYFLEHHESKVVSILEVGFGTGLNFLLSANYCIENQIIIDYTGIEAYPLSEEMITATGYNKYVSKELWKDFTVEHSKSLDGPIQLNAFCQLHISHCKLNDFQSDKQFNIIYFDAFAAAYQPEMWDEQSITHTIKFLKPGGVFVTYAITGNLKRTIKALGLKVEKAPGAPGKREMLRATADLA